MPRMHETSGNGTVAAVHPSATDESRFCNSDELRYSLRSLHRSARWVRRIHLVTDGQVPSWLRRSDPRIHIVDHREILGGSRFNSHAIESALHRIPGLAEHYLYLNDDVMFGRIAHPSDFFAAKGVSRFFPSDLPIDAGSASPADPPIMAAAKNGRDLLFERFGIDVRTKVRHTVHPQMRSVAAQIEQENPEAVARTRSALFRSSADLSIAASLHHWYAYAQGRAVPSAVNYLYVDLAAPQAGQALDALESLRRYDTFCLNTEENMLKPRMRAELASFLDRITSRIPPRGSNLPWQHQPPTKELDDVDDDLCPQLSDPGPPPRSTPSLIECDPLSVRSPRREPYLDRSRSTATICSIGGPPIPTYRHWCLEPGAEGGTRKSPRSTPPDRAMECFGLKSSHRDPT